MKLPRYIVITKDGKAKEYFTEQQLVNAFLKQEFTTEENIYAVKERLQLKPTALVIPTAKRGGVDETTEETHE